jgi:hypothetical protein
MPPLPELMNRITTVEIPNTLQHQFAYSANSVVLYAGYSERDTAKDAEEGWLIYYFQYNGNRQVISRTTAVSGSWDDRGSLVYA